MNAGWKTHPILRTIEPVIRAARHVQLRSEGVARVAQRLAAEPFPLPRFTSPAPEGASAEEVADLYFVADAINFAFTDFETGEIFRVVEGERTYLDADAMVFCLRRACESGVPLGRGSWLRRLDLERAAEIFRGECPIPLLEERCRVLNEVGAALEDRFGGRFHRYLRRFRPRAYSGGEGLLENLVRDFPAYFDARRYAGSEVLFHKRAQLLLWQLHCALRERGYFELEDLDRLTIFADYILPMALELLGVIRYSEDLKRAIDGRRVLPEGSEQEVEIRAFTIWACQLLSGAINRQRPAADQIVPAQLDAWLWFHYHEVAHPHHLTRTTSY